MSISPSRNLDSTSSSSSEAPSQNPKIHHGFPSSSSSGEREQTSGRFLGSLGISTSLSNSIASANFSGSPYPAAEELNGSSNKVTETRNVIGSLVQQSKGKILQEEPSVQAGVLTNHHEKSCKINASTGSHQSYRYSGSQGIAKTSVGRKAHVSSGNHLLNFHYDPISRPYHRVPPPRRQQKRMPYNKDLFLQANYKFVMLDSGDLQPQSMDPDKMVRWDDIICVKYPTSLPICCSICLEYPLCPQITSCGHIFCFPCILQYLLMGEDDEKTKIWKKCPLCFMMISMSDLYAIGIENVKQYHVGDTIDFILLNRRKNSFTLSIKKNEDAKSNDEFQDSFSQFMVTSDVDLAFREAISDLDGWLAKAGSGLVDDLEKLPYVCQAMEQLVQRRNYWNERISLGNKVQNDISFCTSIHGTKNASSGDLVIYQSAQGANSGIASENSKLLDKLSPDKKDRESHIFQTTDAVRLMDDHDGSTLSCYDDNNCKGTHSNDRNSYNFYQAVDGQYFILHPLNMKCLLRHYGSYDRLPNRISGRILQLETVTQSEATRKRYRYLSHFSLTTTFQLCEIDLSEVLPADALSPFMDEINFREKQRKQLARKEQEEKVKADAEVARLMSVPFNFGKAFDEKSQPTFSLEDFEALGRSTGTSISSPSGRRTSFSNVARFGFAAGHDSPALKTVEVQSHHEVDMSRNTNGATGLSNSRSPSFASVTSKAKPEVTDMSNTNEARKKGKRSSRVLLSTTGGRRY